MEGWWQNESLLKFETPTSMFIVGPSNSGKTFFTKRLLEMSSGMFKTPPSRIYFCFSVWQELYDQMSKSVPNIHFHKGLPSMEELREWGEQKGHKIVVLDDLMMDAVDSLEIAHMMCVGSHHYNKGNNKITEHRAIFQRESQNS